MDTLIVLLSATKVEPYSVCNNRSFASYRLQPLSFMWLLDGKTVKKACRSMAYAVIKRNIIRTVAG